MHHPSTELHAHAGGGGGMGSKRKRGKVSDMSNLWNGGAEAPMVNRPPPKTEKLTGEKLKRWPVKPPYSPPPSPQSQAYRGMPPPIRIEPWFAIAPPSLPRRQHNPRPGSTPSPPPSDRLVAGVRATFHVARNRPLFPVPTFPTPPPLPQWLAVLSCVWGGRRGPGGPWRRCG